MRRRMWTGVLVGVAGEHAGQEIDAVCDLWKTVSVGSTASESSPAKARLNGNEAETK